MTDILEVVGPILLAMAVSVALYRWRRGPFSLAMICVSGVMFLVMAAVGVYFGWVFDPYSRTDRGLSIVLPVSNVAFYGFWLCLPLLGLAHLVWTLRRRNVS